MTVVDVLWQRHRWTLTFVALALGVGAFVGATAQLVVTLQAPSGSRSTFYIELFFAALAALLVMSLLLSRTKTGLPLLLAVLAFLPSRTGMQWQYFGYAIISAADVAVVVGFIALVVVTKVRHKERLQPVVVRTPLWIWVVVGLVGALVAIARGVPWLNYLPEIKGFYLWILIVVLCVNVIRTRLTLQLIMATAVLSAIPSVFVQIKDAASGQGTFTLLANGAVVARTAGDAGLINQFAFYIMVVFFVALGLGMATRRWTIRLFYFACAVFLLVGIGLTYTRGAWIATIVGLLVLGIAGGRRVLAGLLAAGAAAYLLIPSIIWARVNFADNSVGERVNYLSTALAVVRSTPVLGGGWGSNYNLVARVVAPDFTPGNLPWWHNDYLVVATQVGLPGLAVFLWIWVALIVATVRAYRRAPAGPLRTYLLVLLAAVVAMCTQATTDMFYWRNDTGPLIWLIVGLMCATINLIADERLTPLIPEVTMRRWRRLLPLRRGAR